MNKNKKIMITLTISAIIIFGGFFSKNIVDIDGQISDDSEAGTVSPNAVSTLYYNGYAAFDQYLGVGDAIYWQFSGTYGVDISVLLMDLDNYATFIYDRMLYVSEYWLLSSGKSSDSGSVSFCRSDDWVIIFWNTDPGHGVSVLTYYGSYQSGAITSITEPDPGETWVAGQSALISWTTSGYIPKVTIELLDAYYFVRYVVTGYTVPGYSAGGSGSYTWSIPASLDPSSTYQIRIKNYAKTTQVRTSSYFSITASKSVTVTSPTSSSSWQAGSTQSITWTSSGCSYKAIIKLYYNGGFLSTITRFGTVNNGFYSWTLPSSFANYADRYQIKVEDFDDSSTYDYSAAYFAITAPAPPDSITVTSPTSSSSWQAGTSHVLTWTSTGSISNVDILLYYNGGLSSTITSSTTNDGSYTWTLPSSFANYADLYQIRVEDSSNSATNDYSTAYFAITAPAPVDSITVTSPTASSSWQAGTSHSITWSSTGSISNVDILLYYNGGYHSTILSSTTNDGLYSWTLPSSFASYADLYQIRIEDSSNSATFDYSTAYFVITAPPPVDSITLTSPTASSSWQAGTSHSITWTSTGSISNVDILLYYNGGYHSTILSSTTNDGSYYWTLASSYTYYSDLYQIRIEDSSNSATNDYSAPYFAITAPTITDSITVTSPTVSSSWQAGTSHSITWTSTGSISNVDILLYYNGGYHSTILSSTTNDGSYDWTLSSSFTDYADLYQIRIEDSSNSVINDYSTAYFEITNPTIAESITVTSPTASSSWRAGTSHSITWTSTGSISNVDILLYYNGGYHSTILSSTTNDGSYTWTLPSSFASYADLYQIRIEDSSNSATNDYSAAYFAITEISIVASITITSPTASSSWQAGTTQTITWTSTGSISNVKIRLYYNGDFHSTIVSSTTNDGSYTWILPSEFNSYSDHYQVRIEDIPLNNYVYSLAYFEITAPSPSPTTSQSVSKTGIGLPIFASSLMIVAIISLLMRRKEK